MKTLITLAAVGCTFLANAAIINLQRGVNSTSIRGKVIAAEVATVSASQTVAIKQIVRVTDMTNAWKTVVTPHTRYDFTITNWDGNASISTNVLDVFRYSDWYIGGITNRIVGRVVPVATNISERVSAGQLPGATYVKTNDVISVTASGHFGSDEPDSATYILDGEILMTAGDDDDRAVILIQQ